MKKRIIALICVCVIILLLVPSAFAESISMTEFNNRVNSMSGYKNVSQIYNSDKIWYDGKYQTGYVCVNNHGCFECMAWGEKMFDTVWKQSIHTNSTQHTNVSNLCVGDYVRYRGGDTFDHSIFITKISGDNVWFTEGNYDWNNSIRFDVQTTKSNLQSLVNKTLYAGGTGFIIHHNNNNLGSGDTSFFDFWGVDDNITISDTYKFWFKEEGYNNCDVNLSINGIALGTIYPDAAGYLSYNLDTTCYNDGDYTISAIIRSTDGREKSVSRNVTIKNNLYFDFWGVDNNLTLSNTYKFWLKEIGYSNSSVDIYLNEKNLGTIYPDAAGYLSYNLDTTCYNDGDYTIKAIIHSSNITDKTCTRNFTIENDKYFGFWGLNNNTTISGLFKIWMKNQNCQGNKAEIYLDINHIATVYQDAAGFFSHSFNSLYYRNGEHTLRCVLKNNDLVTRDESITINIKNEDNLQIQPTIIKENEYIIYSSLLNLNQSATYYVASYTTDGRVIEVNSKAVNSGDTECELPLSKNKDISYFKAFLWDENMQPLSDAERLEL